MSAADFTLEYLRRNDDCRQDFQTAALTGWLVGRLGEANYSQFAALASQSNPTSSSS